MKRMPFRIGTLIMAMLVLSLLAMTACSQPSPAETPETPAATEAPATPEAPTTPEKNEEVIKLKLSSAFFEMEAPSLYGAHFADLVEAKTGGRVKIDRFWGGTIASEEEHVTMLASGSLDLIVLHLAPHAQELPLCSFVPSNLPLERSEALSWIHDYRADPAVKEIMDEEQQALGIKIFQYNQCGSSVVVSKDEITSTSGLSGKKVALMSATSIPTYEKLGWEPVNVYVPEVYEGLSRGMIDGAFGALAAAYHLKWYEICQTLLYMNTFTADLPMAINLEKYEGLSPEIQQAFIEAAEETAEWSNQIDKETVDSAIIEMENAGCTVIDVTGAESMAFFEAYTTPMYDYWLETAQKAGVGDEAQTILDTMESQIATLIASQ